MGKVTTGLGEFHPIRSHQRDEVRRWKSKLSSSSVLLSNSLVRCKVVSIKISTKMRHHLVYFSEATLEDVAGSVVESNHDNFSIKNVNFLATSH